MSWDDWDAEDKRAEDVRKQRHDAAMLKHAELANNIRWWSLCTLLMLPFIAFAAWGIYDHITNGKKVTDWVIQQDDQKWIATSIIYDWESEVRFICEGEVVTVRHPDSITQRKYRVKPAN
jgi:hypothetical protein